MSKINKILIYTEGESELILFNQYLKKYFKNNYNIETECQSGDIPSFKRKISRNMFFDYKQIFILRDLKTELKGIINYPCITKMKHDYTTKTDKRFLGNIGRSYEFIVVCNEIESWTLTFKKITNNRNEKHIQEIYKELNCNNKVKCMQKIVQKLNNGELTFKISDNSSFKYFVDKLELCK
ncbi:MAG: hypothetical protein PHH41_08050 [Sulfurimonas sp.]|jgi:hypothetical protein|nr:hypothetical protein [Sulfurimonas sp.]MDD5203075.1 hypothetical protein [Sulfurimonas sp.]